jgi:signal transduction histidine kinase/ligand-binding sensor domain-containing protein/DNA-binding response OmpR family regulator
MQYSPKLWLLCGWLLALAQVGWAQDVAPHDFRFEHITVDQGLSHSDAMCMAQDPAGFIWVGTNRGLNRYDGYDLRQYLLPINPRNGQSSNRIKALLAAPGGRLWVGVERAGLSYYDAAHDVFRSLADVPMPTSCRAAAAQLAQSDANALVADAQGRLWVGTAQSGVFVLTVDAQAHVLSLRQLPPTQPGRASLVDVTSLAADAEGKVWVGTATAGLQVVRGAEPGLPVAAAALPGTAIHALYLDRRGDLWVGTDRRLFWVPAASRRTVRELTAHPLALALPSIQSLLLDSMGRLWVGTTYGLYVWSAGVVTGSAPPLQPAPTLLLPQDGEPYSLNSERVHQLMESRDEVVWLCASAGGLNKVDLRQKAFGQLRQQRAGTLTLANNYINAIYKEEATNTLWFGTRNGVSAYDLERHTYRSYLNQPASAVQGVDVATIFRAADGTLWFGTRDNGLVSLRRHGGREQLTTYQHLPGGLNLSTMSIEHLAQDGQGRLWVATFADGLLCFDADGHFLQRYDQHNSPLTTNHLTYLLYDSRRDVLWASTRDAGLFELRPTAVGPPRLLAQFRYAPGQANSLRVNYVWPLLLDAQGALWVGTIGGGLHQLVLDAQGRGTVRAYPELPETDVESLLADDGGNLWIGGNGLYRFTPATRQYLRYGVADGLQSNSFKISSAARAQDGTLYFGGINGINYFQPSTIQPNPHPPVVQLTGLRLANQPVPVGREFAGRVVLARPLAQLQTVTIRPSENDFSVDFVGLNYANPQKTSYAYQLEGYNAGWVAPAPGQRTASFANLPPGQYTLRLKASNGEGAWSAPVAPIQFEVLAPWYKTGWAYLLYISILLGLIALYRRFEIAQQELKNKLVLEQFQAEKEKELTGLKLGFFTNVSHELRTPLTLILGPMEEIIGAPGSVADLRGKVQLMHQQARKLLELVNQLLDFRKVESGYVPLRTSYAEASHLIAESYAGFQLKAQERAITYVLAAPAAPVWLYVDRSKLEIILTNLLANAFKYTHDKGRVEVSVAAIGDADAEASYDHGSLVGNYLRVSVSDTGVGISPHELDRIFDPYYQASHTNTLRMGGTGIGLALARQFAQRHGGQLTVASTQGVGTSFELRLPFGRQHLQPEDILPDEPASHDERPAEPELAELEAQPAKAPAGPPRLLVVEDNDEVRHYLRQLFEADYEVLTAEDGLLGWDAALSQLPDLIISDVMMPRSDGLELCRKLKQHPKTSHIPVLLLTARTAETHQLEGLGVGADDYVSKPFAPTVLHAKAEALLLNRRKLHEFYQRRILLQPTEIVVADADREFLEQAMGVVEKYLADAEFSVQVLVREMAMSQSAFYRRIKSITGQTVVEFIRDVRLKRAAQLLTQTTMRVSEVAFEVGIEDAKYFRKAFQKTYSLTPSEYAKQHRAGAAASPVAAGSPDVSGALG